MLIEQAHHLISKDYELPQLDPPANNITEAQTGHDFQGKEKIPRVDGIFLSSLLISYVNNDLNFC